MFVVIAQIRLFISLFHAVIALLGPRRTNTDAAQTRHASRRPLRDAKEKNRRQGWNSHPLRSGQARHLQTLRLVPAGSLAQHFPHMLACLMGMIPD